MPVIPATWEAETGESLDALQPGQRERNSVSKERKKGTWRKVDSDGRALKLFSHSEHSPNQMESDGG